MGKLTSSAPSVQNIPKEPRTVPNHPPKCIVRHSEYERWRNNGKMWHIIVLPAGMFTVIGDNAYIPGISSVMVLHLLLGFKTHRKED